MNKKTPELQWMEFSEQEIPTLPEYDSMILTGGITEPDYWQPPQEEIIIEEVSVTAESSPLNERPEWLLRFTASDLILPLREEAITIGSSAFNDLIIDDPTISKKHVLLKPDFNGWILEDLDSLNGTYVDGMRISEPVFLEENGEFTLARNRKFRIEKVETDEQL